MKKILAFAGSNSANSINHQLVEFTASQLKDADVKVLDIRSWDVPMYSMDMDPDQTPEKITELISLIQEHDGFVLASPEHNGGTPAFLKNIIDWLSRRGKKVFDSKPIFLMSTSPGQGGGATNLKYLIASIPYQGATVSATYAFPSFQDNFQDGKIVGEQLGEFQKSLEQFKAALNG